MTQRIEYIDAMRGFAMLIVVLHHISLMCLGIDSVFEKWAYEFRMPLFFFIIRASNSFSKIGDYFEFVSEN